MTEDSHSESEHYSFNLRSRAIPRSDPHSKRTKRVASSDRVLVIAQRSLDADSITNMATAAERQVHVSTDEQFTRSESRGRYFRITRRN
jgi:hypothetical protein